MKYLTIIAPIFLIACSNYPVGNTNVPEPVKMVELEHYLGKWYELARYENRFEEGCEAVTAEYAKRDDGLIHIVNTCRKDSVDGKREVAIGKAKIVKDSGGAKLKVSFFGPFFFGDYWVLDRAEDYSWSIVGEPSGKYLWILTRDAVPDKQKRDALIARVKTLGYDTSLLYFPKQPPAN